MKTFTSILLLTVTIFVSHVYGYLIQVPTAPVLEPRITAPAQWIGMQKLITPLFENICEVSSNPVIQTVAQQFQMNPEFFEKTEVITNLKNLISSGILPKGEIFSEYNTEHVSELKILYEVLYYAKDFDVFYQAAAWARQNVNCVLYVNAVYMAIQKRKDTERLSIPAPYELIPNYFIRKDVIATASSIISGQQIIPTEGIRVEGNIYTMDANYTSLFYDNVDESRLAYFREDLGLNSFYYFKKLSLMPWSNQDINGNYGEQMFQMMKQLMARYNLERYANGFSETESLNWDLLPDIPYDPMLIYSNGNDFSFRSSYFQLKANEGLELLKTIESNIETVVNHMRQSGYNKTQILNHLMEILVTGDRSYETLARQLFGKDNNNGYASAMDHYMTSLRDPMFWIINNKIIQLIDNALKILPSYSRSELYFPGVQIENIEVKKMITTYDYFAFDITDALKIDDTSSVVKIKIGQPRLNHKPFTIKVNVSSLVSEKGLVKIYLGPKMIPGELATKKNQFTLLDTFEVNLKLGTNIITRTSDQMKQFADDFLSLPSIRKNIEDAEFGLKSLSFTTISSQITYPSRLILPKGASQGLPIQMFVFIAPYVKASMNTNDMKFNSAILSPGYPLDLMVEKNSLFELPNALVKYVVITQKGDDKVENFGGPGVTKKWYSNYESSYDPSSRPNYSAREPFDYKSKQGNYGKGNIYKADYNKGIDNEYSVIRNEVISNENEEDDLTVIPHTLVSSVTHPDFSSELYKEPYEKQSKTIKIDKEDSKKILIDKEDSSDKQGEYGKHSTITIEETNTHPLESEHNITSNSVENSKTDIDVKPRLLSLVANYGQSPKMPRKEPFDYKSHKQQFDKTYYINKRKESYDVVTPKNILTPTHSNSQEIITPIDGEKTYSLSNMNSESIENNPISKGFEDNSKIYTEIKPLLLKSIANDDESQTYQRKEKFDYKAKKKEFDKKYYITKRKESYKLVTPKSTITPEHIKVNIDSNEGIHLINDAQTVDNNNILDDSIKYDYENKDPLSYKVKETNFNKKKTVTLKENDFPTDESPVFSKSNDSKEKVGKIIIINKDDDKGNEISEKKIKILDSTIIDDAIVKKDVEEENTFAPVTEVRRRPSVYDYLFHGFDYEDWKVYE